MCPTVGALRARGQGPGSSRARRLGRFVPEQTEVVASMEPQKVYSVQSRWAGRVRIVRRVVIYQTADDLIDTRAAGGENGGGGT